MMQPYKNAALVLAGLLILLVLVNFLVVMPRSGMTPVQPTVSSTAQQQTGTPKDTIMSVDTLQAIKQGSMEEEEHPLYPEERFTRNPFFWPDEKTAKKKVSKAKKTAPQKPRLSMVIIGEHKKQALLDDVFVTEGSTFHGLRVKRITGKEVVLQSDVGDIHISLAAGSKENTSKQKTGEIGIIER